MKKFFIFILLQSIAGISYIAGQGDSICLPKLKVELNTFDLPYQIYAFRTTKYDNSVVPGFISMYANPSTGQSVSLSSSLYNLLHYGLKKAFAGNASNSFGKRLLRNSSYLIFDFIMTYAPGGDGWLHEEFHRAVMTRHRVNSFNDMNTFPIGHEMVSVNHVHDYDLERFKAESPVDFIRMHIAGIEGEYMLITRLQNENFFYEQNLFHEFLYLFSVTNSISYVMMSGNEKKADRITSQMNEKEPEMMQRDFTGLDFTAWVYDMYHPFEPYANRGVHPLGNGIDRYIKTTDLSESALNYLKLQGRLQWINMISPMMYGIRTISLNDKVKANFSLRHLLTPYGNDIALNVQLKINSKGFIFSWHQSTNFYKSFPAIETTLWKIKSE